MNELKPCPFCGGEAKLMNYNGFGVQCKDEICIGHDLLPACVTREDAIAAWNRRVNGWIPFVMDEEGILQGKIPENEQEILVTDGRQVGFDTFINEDKCYLDSGRDLMATAWMPLPEPLGGEKDV
ncbi:MAG: Lar family restriction alleviation protein [Eubacteriales bacterium]|nr:Lar family restriction alleviation protein [Eubacteriales bacterium]